MDELVPFGSREYFGFLSLLLFGRGMDFLSTWVATPNLLLEANPIARRLHWKLGIPVNMLLCAGFALMPLTAIIIVTTSVLVAARNFQQAWIMRSYGEENYRAWFLERLEETPPTLFLFCLLGQASLPGAVGAVLMYFSDGRDVVPLGIGMGIIGYAAAVLIFTGQALWRHRRLLRDKS
jgi:hypothetical protein